MWYTLLSIVHIIACLFLILVVLLQTGKGGDISAVFGGSSQTLFGGSGAGNFLTKATTAIAILFMVTSLTLSYGTARQQSVSVFDSAPPVSTIPQTQNKEEAASKTTATALPTERAKDPGTGDIPASASESSVSVEAPTQPRTTQSEPAIP
jgi:preprotein translocase subunit SecG